MSNPKPPTPNDRDSRPILPGSSDPPPSIEEIALGRVGRVLKNKWRLDELVGWGGVAAVYAATHRNQKRVAIKILHDELAVAPPIRERFLREGYAANAVGHKSAVQILDDDVTEDGLVFLVMELLTGETLADRLDGAGGRVAWPEALRIATDILTVLEAAHEKGIIHRDLKPENVYLTDDGETKILDFGLARIVSDGGEHSGTRVGLTMGTPGFMPPEQLRGQWHAVDARSDLWALGATLFNILTGRPVYEGIDVRAVLRPPRLRALVSDVPPEIGAIVDRALSPLPSSRFQSAREMRRAIEAANLAAPSSRRRSITPVSTTLPAPLAAPALAPRTPTLDNVRPFEIAPSTYWVGKRDPQAIFHSNPYLRSTKEGECLVIDPGSSSDFAVVSAKVGSLVGGMGAVTGMFINHQDPDVGSSAAMISNRYAPEASIFCSDPTWRLIVHLNLPRDRFVDLDRHRHGFRFGHDDLLPVPSPFCHFRGAVMLYDPSTRVLFTGDFLGGVTEPGAQGVWADKSDWSGIRAFHQTYMPTQRVLANTVRAIRELDMPIDVVAPQHGRLLRGSLIHEFLDRLERLPVGLDLMDDIGDGADALAAWSSVFNRVLHTAQMVLSGEDVAAAARHEAIAEHLQFRGERAEVLSAGRWTVSNLVRLLVQRRPPSIANAITLEALHACDELELPSPEIQLDMGAARDRRTTEAAAPG